jgi:uncharacterized protein (DUF885 family)
MRNRVILLVVGLLAIGVAALAVPTVWLKPYMVEHLYARMFGRQALHSPMLLSELQVLPPVVDFYGGRLDNRSLAFAEKQTQRLERDLHILRSYDRNAIRDRLSYDVAEWVAADRLAAHEFRFHGYPLNPVSGEQKSLPAFMLTTHRVESAWDARNYVERLKQFDEYFFHVVVDLNAREEKGITPPRLLVEQMLAEMRAFISTPPTEHVLYTHLRERLESLPDVEPVDRQAALARADTALRQHVYPAYIRLIAYGEHLAKIATSDATGAWKLPDGEKYYQFQLRRHTTTDMTAEQLHQLGRQEVARIEAAIRQILRARGHATTGVAATATHILRQARFQWPNSDAGRSDILAEYRRILGEVGGGLDSLFEALPAAQVVVERVPAHQEAARPFASYHAPASDGSHAGVLSINLRDVREHARPRMRTIAYHEAIPGHHLQTSSVQQRDALPFFRSIIHFPAFSEGWALYAEQLAAEAGFHNDPYSRIAYLLDQLRSAVGLVVDTGIHDKRWTREQAIDYMRRHTGMSESEMVAAFDRHIVMPGVAAAHTVGRLKILELRERARQRLGDRFDLRAFHTVVLRNGEIPLAVLERTVDEWIASRQ